MHDVRQYWDSFYAGKSSTDVPDKPSTFAKWVIDRLQPDQTVIEFGFGNGRDSFWFARRGYLVRGFDFASSAVAQANGQDGYPNAKFGEHDLADSARTELLAKDLARDYLSPAIFGRFLIHSLVDEARGNLFNLAATALSEGGELYLEFRTGLDRNQTHIFGEDHFRQFLEPSAIERELQSRGATVTYSVAGTGYSVYKSEDPHIARIVAAWST